MSDDKTQPMTGAPLDRTAVDARRADVAAMRDRQLARECECLPGAVCAPCTDKGYQNGLAGYAQRIYPEQVTDADMAAQEGHDTELEREA